MAFSVSKYFRLSTYLNGASAENGKVNQKEPLTAALMSNAE